MAFDSTEFIRDEANILENIVLYAADGPDEEALAWDAIAAYALGRSKTLAAN